MMTKLRQECLLFEDHRKIVALKEKGVAFRGRNTQGKSLACYIVDNCIIKRGAKCDFLLLVTDNKSEARAYFVELKGSDISHAIEQLEQSILKLGKSLPKCKLNARLVLRKVRNPNSLSPREVRFKKFLKKYHGNYVKATVQLEEDI